METQGLLCSNPHCSVCLIEYNSAISTTHLNHALGKRFQKAVPFCLKPAGCAGSRDGPAHTDRRLTIVTPTYTET